MHIKPWGKTDPGKTRKKNDDSLHIDLERGVFLIADGLGGHAAGGEASLLLTEIVRQQAEDLSRLLCGGRTGAIPLIRGT